MDSNLHFSELRLIELRIEHGALDVMLNRVSGEAPLLKRCWKKMRLGLRSEIVRIEQILTPDWPA